MLSYLQIAVIMCKANKISPSFLLHPLDFIGGDDEPGLSFFPGMNYNGKQKLQLFHLIMGKLTRDFQFLPMGKYADYLLSNEKLTVKKIS